MDITKLIGILGLGISVLAALVSLGVLLQMRNDTLLARHDSELRIRPIVFVRDVSLDVDSDGSVTSINVSVVNAGLGPALNVVTELAADVIMPGSGAILRKELFSQSTIIQVLPNGEGNLQGSLAVTIHGDAAVVDLSRAQVLPAEYSANAANAKLSVVRRPDGQAQLKLDALKVTKEELEKALSDALYRVSCTSMTNNLVSYTNRPSRSESLERVDVQTK